MMYNLFLIYETCTNGYRIDVFDIISMLAILCGILVIISKNPVVAVLFLIGLFASISCNLIMLGLSFIGLTYLMVYIGAVSILFLFILMLINVRISELQSNTTNSIALAIALGIAFNYPIFKVLPYNIAILNNYYNLNSKLYNIYLNPEGWHTSYAERSNGLPEAFGRYGAPQSKVVTSGASGGTFSTYSDDKYIYFVTSKTWDGNIIENNHITSIGNVMYTSHNMWLFIASFILLLSMVGAIVITMKSTKSSGHYS